MTKKSLRQRIEEKLEASRNNNDSKERQRSRMKSQASSRQEFQDHCSSRMSANSVKSKSSAKQKGKAAKNFIVLNAEQLKRIQSSLSKQ